MRKTGILNAELISEIASIGHTQYFIIADAGLPIPEKTKVIDLAVTAGLPCFLDVFRAVNDEIVSEAYILANEITNKNAELHKNILRLTEEKQVTYVSHEELKKISEEAQVIVRTGETSPYANIVIKAGVNF